MRRELGQGRWDKILMKRMLALSVSDDYTVARDEWIATGDVWWSGSYSIPDWVQNSTHPNHCLCGHGIVYHFRIRNTENGVEEIVGSDHINSYLIMRQIAEEKGIDLSTVSDEQVELWLKERVGSMKAEAWWEENGDAFTNMFDAIKEMDLWTNVYLKEKVYVPKRNRYEYKRVLRKKGSGDYGLNYDMASIVWRWNHPNNPKAQIKTRGFPNEKLMMDLSLFFAKSFELRPAFDRFQQEKIERTVEVADSRRREQERRERLAQERRERERERLRKWEEGRPAREAKEAENNLLRRQRRRKELKAEEKEARAFLDMDGGQQFENMCGFYGIPVFDSSFAANAEDAIFLKQLKVSIYTGDMNATSLNKMREIFDGSPATTKQIKYLRDLGFEGDIPSKRFASRKITEIKGE